MAISVKTSEALKEVSDMLERIRSDMRDLAKKMNAFFSGLSKRLVVLRRNNAFSMSRKILMIAVNLVLWLIGNLWFSLDVIFCHVNNITAPYIAPFRQSRLCSIISSDDDPTL